MLAVAIAGASCVTRPASREVLPSPHPRADEIRTAMAERMIIPEVNLHAEPVRDAVDFMFNSAREHDPQHRGMSFVLRLNGHATRAVTVAAKDVAVLDLLNEICAQAGLVWRLTASVVLIEPETMEPNPGVHSISEGLEDDPFREE